MPTYKFTAKKVSGEKLENTREAENQFTLAKDLRKEGYILVDFKQEGKKKRIDLNNLSFGGVPLSEKVIFAHNLAVMVGAGLPLARALKILIDQTKNVKLKNTLTAVSISITKGKSLSESLAEHGKIFSKLFVSMVKSGEKGGKLKESLNLIADQMEKEAKLKKKVLGAMIYPSIVLMAMVGISILMLVYVVPALTSTFEELGVDLPLSTQIIVWLSESLVKNALIVLLLVVMLGVGGFFLFKKPIVKKGFSFILLRTPIISKLIQKINSARTARTLSSLIDSGVEILEAIDMTSDVVQNIYYKNVLKDAKAFIQKGDSISSSFKKAKNIYPPLFGEMVAVGEETGKLSEMLLQIADFYEEEVDEATKNLTTVVEPFLMLFIGVFVGFFAVSMMKPMYSMMGGL